MIVPGDDDSLDIWVVFLDRLQNTQSTIDCRVEQLFGIVGVHVEWRSGMSYRVNSLDSFVECPFLKKPYQSLSNLIRLQTYLSDILDDYIFEGDLGAFEKVDQELSLVL